MTGPQGMAKLDPKGTVGTISEHGQVGPQGHSWHDLCMGPQDIANEKSQ